MPRSWFDYHANSLPDSATDEQIAQREFNLRILADRKPYFMCYIYPTMMKQYKTYMRNVDVKCAREFRMSINELLDIPQEDRTPEQANFISYYERRLPVSAGGCLMNRICRRIEDEFDGKMQTWCEEPFDYTIMKSGSEYAYETVDAVRRVYDEHNNALRNLEHIQELDRVETASERKRILEENFRRKCLEICNEDDTLCDTVLDMCYKKSGTKAFAWGICGDTIISHLIARNGGVVSYPVRDDDGEFEYRGHRFSIHTAEISAGITEEYNIERDYPEREGMGGESD